MHKTEKILRDLREDKDLKQSDIAEIIGTTQQQYSKYETGESEISCRVLIILADYYNVSTDFLLGRTACREGIAALNKKINTNKTIGSMVTSILSLDTDGQNAIFECIFLQQLKQQYLKTK